MSDWEVEHMKAMDKKIQSLRDENKRLKAWTDQLEEEKETAFVSQTWGSVHLHGAELAAVQFWIEKAASKYDLNSEGGTLQTALKALSISAPKPGSGGCGCSKDLPFGVCSQYELVASFGGLCGGCRHPKSCHAPAEPVQKAQQEPTCSECGGSGEIDCEDPACAAVPCAVKCPTCAVKP